MFLSIDGLMKFNKKGKISEKTLETGFYTIVLLVVIFKAYAVLVPEAQTAGDELNASGVPLGGLFSSDGVVFLIIMAALILVIVRSVMGKKK